MTADITTWQGRLIAERDELAAKLVKLGAFLNATTVPVQLDDFALLTAQSHIMQAYLVILNRRLERAEATSCR